jgi:5-methylcytosine-specific restriction endonuclease McrA
MSKSNWPTESRHKRGYGAEWDKVRKLVLERNEHLCQCRHCKAEGRVTEKAKEWALNEPTRPGNVPEPGAAA